jgi:hypothetical protein
MMSIIIASLLEGKAMNSGEVFWGADKPEGTSFTILIYREQVEAAVNINFPCTVGYVPGTLGFDPLNLYKIRGNKMVMETAEVKNGRLAMIAITAYVFQEAVSGVPVVQETPYLF